MTESSRRQNSASLLIDGLWSDGGGAAMRSLNPLTGTSIWHGRCADSSDIQRAVRSAGHALSAWRALHIDQRVAMLLRFNELLKRDREVFAQLIHEETGKPTWECRTEVDAMLGKLSLSLDAYHERTGDRSSESRGIQATLSHRAIGVLAVLGPFNFPGHLPNGHIIPALLAGNTLVFKPSEQTPAVGLRMAELWCEAGLPPGVLNVVLGDAKCGAELASSAMIDGVLFTGSARAGRALHQSMVDAPHKILALEMGGNNPLVVSRVSNLDAAAYIIVQSAFMSAGQRCTCARRLILCRSDTNQRLLERVIEFCNALRIGADENCFYGSLINLAAAEKAYEFQQNLIDLGAEPLLYLRSIRDGTALLSPSIIDVSGLTEPPDEECFGPLLQVTWVDDLDSAINAANRTRFGLAAGLLSDSASEWNIFFNASRAGIVNWNQPLTGASSALPFGGTGDSGNHRPSAYYAADYCAYPVASMQQAYLRSPSNCLPGLQM